jgi:hypothetical protein
MAKKLYFESDDAPQKVMWRSSGGDIPMVRENSERSRKTVAEERAVWEISSE